jgi:hypothetical protein
MPKHLSARPPEDATEERRVGSRSSERYTSHYISVVRATLPHWAGCTNGGTNPESSPQGAQRDGYGWLRNCTTTIPHG